MARAWFRSGLLIPALLLGLAMTAPARPAEPGPEFKLYPDDDGKFTSPDRQIRIEQYFADKGDAGYLYRFWAFDRNREHASVLNGDEDPDLAMYPAGFRFSADSQWLVRMQKTGSGSQSLFLYRRTGNEFASATKMPISDMAWDYFWGTPTAKKLRRDPKDRDELSHVFAGLVKGMDTNYAWLGTHWRDSRYIVISLSFDAQGEEHKLPWIEDWWCAYDLKTGTFSVPAALAAHNAKTIALPPRRRR